MAFAGLSGRSLIKNLKPKKMIEAMRHRGPDDFGIYEGNHATLGMTRLAILDLSQKGHQPMSNRQKDIWLVYNGEMYNFPQEKENLIRKGYHFRSTSDTEVVIAMYEEYGDDFLLRMRGMFALAILDQRPGKGKEKILLARDHLGIKPLLYFQQGHNFVFASELKSILASGLISKKIEPEALRTLLTYGSVTQPLTMITQVKMLMPGCRLIFQNGCVKIEKYWHLALDRYPIRHQSRREQTRIVKEELQKIVKMQMISDVPIGAFLSGGVDSSLLVALMSQLSGVKTKTFSVGFEKEGQSIDETDDAQKIAKFLKTTHHKVLVKASDIRAQINHLAGALDQPSVDGANSYFVSAAAKKGVTVAISGTGGDELFAGYPWFANMMNMYLKKSPSSPERLLARFLAQDSFNFLMQGPLKYPLDALRQRDFLSQFTRQYQIFGSIMTGEILAESMKKLAKIGREPAIDFTLADELPNGNPIDRVTALCLRGYTQNQLLRDIDAVSMAHSLEVRVPFLDPILADLALSLPSKAKLAHLGSLTSHAENQTYRELGAKKILIEIGKNLLPKNMDRQPKRGFGLPFDYWLQGALKDILAETLSAKVVKKRGFFDPEQVSLYDKDYQDGKIGWPIVWLLMMIELWAREVLDV